MLLHTTLQSTEFAEMVDDLDDATRRRRKHIAGIRKCYVHTILGLQEEHRSEGINDPKGIACMAKSCTKYSRRDAITRGKDMALEVSAARRIGKTQDTLAIIDSVLDIMESSPPLCRQEPRKQETKRDMCLQPPRRLLSPSAP